MSEVLFRTWLSTSNLSKRLKLFTFYSEAGSPFVFSHLLHTGSFSFSCTDPRQCLFRLPDICDFNAIPPVSN